MGLQAVAERAEHFPLQVPVPLVRLTQERHWSQGITLLDGRENTVRVSGGYILRAPGLVPALQHRPDALSGLYADSLRLFI
jgi:hypothetical protein